MYEVQRFRLTRRGTVGDLRPVDRDGTHRQPRSVVLGAQHPRVGDRRTSIPTIRITDSAAAFGIIGLGRNLVWMILPIIVVLFRRARSSSRSRRSPART